MIINMNGAKAPETPSPILQEKTVTPETLPTVVGADEGYDGLSQVTINPDSQLKAENIRSGKTIFGVGGTFEGVNTGDALSNTELISYVDLDTQYYGARLFPIGSKLTYTPNSEPDTTSKFRYNGGINQNDLVLITDENSPLNVKKSYGVFITNTAANTSTMTISSSYSSGRVSGNFSKEYTGSPIYTGETISRLLRFAEMEYGIYEYNVHISGFFTIFDSLQGMSGYINSLERFPLFFEGDVVIKYRNDTSSSNSGIVDIVGLPNVELENVAVASSSSNPDFYLIFATSGMYFNALPTKVE